MSQNFLHPKLSRLAHLLSFASLFKSRYLGAKVPYGEENQERQGREEELQLEGVKLKFKAVVLLETLGRKFCSAQNGT